MAKRKRIDIAAFDYELPDDRIAKYPLENRDGSKLLYYNHQKAVSQHAFMELHTLLPEKSLLVFNNTRVIHARLAFQKQTGARIEIFCLSPENPKDYYSCLEATGSCVWKCMVGNLKKWKEGDLYHILELKGEQIRLRAKRLQQAGEGSWLIEFTWEGSCSFAEILEVSGKIPIPPYLNRESERLDSSRYQTVYSKIKGSVAAPTAGLHFTPKVLSQLSKKGHDLAELTLHVGAGTFKPVKTEDACEHEMHAEEFEVSNNLLQKLINHPSRIIATGTTSLRTLESLYWLGVKCLEGSDPSFLSQWEHEELPSKIPAKKAFQALLEYNANIEQDLQAKTQIMITPGYEFRVIDGLITNFHQPRSTLLLLIAAITGNDWKKIYDYALANKFRFLSYGDSSLLLRH